MAARQYSFPLHQAIVKGNLQRIKRLVKVKGIDINKTEEITGVKNEVIRVVNPLYLALTMKYNQENLRVQILKVLFSHPELSVNVYQINNKSSCFSKGAVSSIDDARKNGTSLLHLQIREGSFELVKALVRHPNIDVEDVTTGIVTAMNSKHLSKPSNKKLQNDIIKVLLSHEETMVNMKWFSLEASEASLQTLKTSWPELPDGLEMKDGNTFLDTWIEEGNLDLIKVVIKHPKINVSDVSTSIIDAIRSEHLCKPANKTLQSDIIKALLEHPKINVNVESKGFSALHIGIIKEQVNTVETLLKHPRILVNHKSRSNVTPLFLSMQIIKTKDITKLLLNHPKIDVNLTDDCMGLPINMLVNNQKTFDCFEMLLNHANIDVNAEDEFTGDKTPLISLARTRQLNVNTKECPDAKYYHDKAFKLLMNHKKIDLQINDEDGKNILHHVMKSIVDVKEKQNIFSHTANAGALYEILTEILENHPDLITPDKFGITPINLAIKLPDPFCLMKDVLEKYKIAKVKADKDTKSCKTIERYEKCCWNCDATDVKLYKCTGCKKAYYCSKDCITQDWPIHGGYCQKKQKRKQNMC